MLANHQNIIEEFEILNQYIGNKKLIYFDNAATTQKPKIVTDAISDYYRKINSNIHRGAYSLSFKATEAYENVRKKAAEFVNAGSPEEILFTRGTTEGINLVARSFGQAFVSKGDNVIISAMEHHSNIVPWQMLCEEKEARLRVIPINDAGELELEKLPELIDERTKIISIAYISNVLGTINPVKEVIDLAHSQDIPVLLDAAQSTPHLKTDVRELDCDFLAVSGHKMYGPTGSGFLYGKRKYLDAMPPYEGGGEMIESVSFEKTTYNKLPYKFEAGTPNIAGAVGLGEAIDFISDIGIEKIAKHEDELLKYATDKMKKIDGIKIIGTARKKAAVISFVVKGIHHYDLGTFLDKYGVAIRTGHHCAEPLMNRFGISGTSRISFAVYNTKEEIDIFFEAFEKTINILRR